MVNKKVTARRAASVASMTLKSMSTGNKSKTAAASALSQREAPKKQTSPKAATAASKTLSDRRTSNSSKSAAASASSQADKKR